MSNQEAPLVLTKIFPTSTSPALYLRTLAHISPTFDRPFCFLRRYWSDSVDVPWAPRRLTTMWLIVFRVAAPCKGHLPNIPRFGSLDTLGTSIPVFAQGTLQDPPEIPVSATLVQASVAPGPEDNHLRQSRGTQSLIGALHQKGGGQARVDFQTGQFARLTLPLCTGRPASRGWGPGQRDAGLSASLYFQLTNWTFFVAGRNRTGPTVSREGVIAENAGLLHAVRQTSLLWGGLRRLA